MRHQALKQIILKIVIGFVALCVHAVGLAERLTGENKREDHDHFRCIAGSNRISDDFLRMHCPVAHNDHAVLILVIPVQHIENRILSAWVIALRQQDVIRFILLCNGGIILPVFNCAVTDAALSCHRILRSRFSHTLRNNRCILGD